MKGNHLIGWPLASGVEPSQHIIFYLFSFSPHAVLRGHIIFFFPLKFELNLIFSQVQMNLNIIG